MSPKGSRKVRKASRGGERELKKELSRRGAGSDLGPR